MLGMNSDVEFYKSDSEYTSWYNELRSRHTWQTGSSGQQERPDSATHNYCVQYVNTFHLSSG